MLNELFSKAVWFGLKQIGIIWIVQHVFGLIAIAIVIRFLLKQKAWGLLVILAWALAASDFVSPGMGTFGIPLSINQFMQPSQSTLTVQASDYDDMPTWARNLQEQLDFHQPPPVATEAE